MVEEVTEDDGSDAAQVVLVVIIIKMTDECVDEV